MISIIFLVSCFNALLALVMFLTNWKLNKNILFFVLYMLIVSYTSVMYDMIINGGSVHLLMILIGNAGPLFFLIGPLFYFFIRGLADEEKTFSDMDLLHFVPFFLNMLVLLPYMFSPIDYKLEIARSSMQNLSFYMNSSITLFPIWITTQVNIAVMIYYFVRSGILLYRIYKKVSAGYEPAMKALLFKNFRWLFAIILFSVFFTLLHFGLTLFYRFEPINYENIDADGLFIVSSIANLIFPAIILLNPGILFGMPVVRTDMLSHFRNESGEVRSSAINYSYSAYFEALAVKIIRYIEDTKPYLNFDFSADELCDTFHLPHHHIHFCFRSFIGKSFKRVRDEYRVRHAMALFKKSPCQDVDAMENVRFDSGFDSLSKFKRAFRSVTGKDPLQWCKENT